MSFPVQYRTPALTTPNGADGRPHSPLSRAAILELHSSGTQCSACRLIEYHCASERFHHSSAQPQRSHTCRIPLPRFHGHSGFTSLHPPSLSALRSTCARATHLTVLLLLWQAPLRRSPASRAGTGREWPTAPWHPATGKLRDCPEQTRGGAVRPSSGRWRLPGARRRLPSAARALSGLASPRTLRQESAPAVQAVRGRTPLWRPANPFGVCRRRI